MSEVVEFEGHRCLVVDGVDALRTARDVTDVVGEALSEEATAIAVPVAALDPGFFDLRSGFAGEVLQKAANYRLKFVVIGDVSAHTAASKAFRDLVVESRRSRDFFFVPDLDALGERLSAIARQAAAP